MLIKEQVIALVKKSISKLNWKYQYDEDDELFTIKWHPVYFFADLQMNICIFDEYLTIIVRSDTRVKKNISRVAEFITRINYHLTPGAMEMDCDSGSVRFYQHLAFSEISGHEEDGKDAIVMFISFALIKGLLTYDGCGTDLYSVMLGAESPKKAAKKAESLMSKLSGDDDEDDDDDDDDNDDDDDDNDDDVTDIDDLIDNDDDDDYESDDNDDDHSDTENDDGDTENDDSDTENDDSDTENDDGNTDDDAEKTDGGDTGNDNEEPPRRVMRRVSRRRSVFSHKAKTFDFMDEKRSTIHVDQVIDENDYVIGTETVPDSTKKTSISSHKPKN